MSEIEKHDEEERPDGLPREKLDGTPEEVGRDEVFIIEEKTRGGVEKAAGASESSLLPEIPQDEGLSLLKAGDVKGFNQLRSAYPDWKPYFRKVDLRGAQLQGVCLAGAYIKWSSFCGADLKDADLSNTLDDNMWCVNMNGANLHNAKLHGSNFYEASFKGANLDMANLEGAELAKAILRGASLKNCNLEGATAFGADFRGADCSGAQMKNMSLNHVNFRGALLCSADLSRSEMNGMTWLEGANLRDAKLDGVTVYGDWRGEGAKEEFKRLFTEEQLRGIIFNKG